MKKGKTVQVYRMNINNVKGAQKTLFLTVIRIIFTVRKAGWVLWERIQFRKFNCLCKSQRPNAFCAFCFAVLLYLCMCARVRLSQQMLELFSHLLTMGHETSYRKVTKTTVYSYFYSLRVMASSCSNPFTPPQPFLLPPTRQQFP